MKNLITIDLGGQPVYFKDFEFVQEQIRELAKSAFGQNDDAIITILNGADFTVSTDGYTIVVHDEGWAYYQGEMFYIPVQSATGGTPDVAKWIITEADDPRGLKTFFEDTVGDKNVYKVRTLTVVYVPAANPGVLFDDTVVYHKETAWATLSIQSPWVVEEGVQYKLSKDGDVHVSGVIRGGQPAGTAVIAILPEGFRPKFNTRLLCAAVFISGGTPILDEPINVILDPNGELSSTLPSGVDEAFIYLNLILIID